VTWQPTPQTADSPYEEEFDDDFNRWRHRSKPTRQGPIGLMKIYRFVAEEWQPGSAPS
jgi:hypothetical protein